MDALSRIPRSPSRTAIPVAIPDISPMDALSRNPKSPSKTAIPVAILDIFLMDASSLKAHVSEYILCSIPDMQFLPDILHAGDLIRLSILWYGCGVGQMK